MPAALQVRRLMSLDDVAIDALNDILIDCVAAGASVSFMNPISRAKADGFWRNVARDVDSGARMLFVAQDGAEVIGTVQVVLAQPENQPHRGDVSKLLVHRKARRRGVGEALMQAAEKAAHDAGKTLLVLDTASPDAERLYSRLGWRLCGRIPDYALWPDGGMAATTVFYKPIGALQ
jgi:ribosomal protein S18 acetylase RimI-like enzyme